VFHKYRSPVPVRQRRVEHPGGDVAVSGRREAVRHRQDGDLVNAGPWNELQGDARGIRVDDKPGLSLQCLITFSSLLRVVARLALLDDNLGSANPAVALVEQGQIVVLPVGDRSARAGEGSGPVGEQRDEYGILGLSAWRASK